MTLAGGNKNLQTVYDDGIESVSAIETDTVTKLQNATRKHAQKRKSSTAAHTTIVEDRAKEIEAELYALMDKSLRRLEEMKLNESHRSEEFSETLTHELKRVGEVIKDSVDLIKQSLSDRLDDVHKELASDFDSTMDGHLSKLERGNFESAKEIRAHGAVLANTLQQKLDQNVWESRGSEKQVIAQLYKTYMQKVSGIETHFSNLMQELNKQFQGQYTTLEESAATAKSSSKEEVTRILAEVESISSDVERDISQFFGDLLDGHKRELEEELEAVSREITTSSADADTTLKQKTQEYSSSLLTAATSAHDSLKATCNETVKKGDQMQTRFLDRLDERIEVSQSMRKELESTKADTVEEICNELATLRKNFEESLSRLTTEAENSVASIASEVERDIRSAHARCQAKLAEDGQAAQADIEKEVTRLLDLVGQHKAAALKEIAQAAGN